MLGVSECNKISDVDCIFFFFQAEDGIRDLVRSRGLGDVYKRQCVDCAGGKALDGLGAARLPNPTKLRMPAQGRGSRTTGDEFRSREGNSPDPQLRSSNAGSVANEVGVYRQPGGWLRSSHPLKSA